MEKYGLLTFKSTHFALAAEKLFESENLAFKTIPTPREVSHSCGLAILFILDDLDLVREKIREGSIKSQGLFSYSKGIDDSKLERIE